MNLFKKKDDVPEIPAAPQLPELNFNMPKVNPVVPNLPNSGGDGRDISNQDAIKSAIEDSSEKNIGDTGGIGVPPRDFLQNNGTPMSFNATQNGFVSSVPAPPAQNNALPNLPIYTVQNDNIHSAIPLVPQKKVSKTESAKDENFVPREQAVKKDFNETIFVRIDKFNSAKRDIGEIDRDLKQIENVLEKIMDVKEKEDEEISELNKNIEEIKLRLSRIDNDIFNRI